MQFFLNGDQVAVRQPAYENDGAQTYRQANDDLLTNTQGKAASGSHGF
jgi:hypothetical protein